MSPALLAAVEAARAKLRSARAWDAAPSVLRELRYAVEDAEHDARAARRAARRAER